MNLNVPGVLLLLGGLILSYAAVANKDPREVVMRVFTGKPATTPISQPVTTTTPTPTQQGGTWV